MESLPTVGGITAFFTDAYFFHKMREQRAQEYADALDEQTAEIEASNRRRIDRLERILAAMDADENF